MYLTSPADHRGRDVHTLTLAEVPSKGSCVSSDTAPKVERHLPFAWIAQPISMPHNLRDLPVACEEKLV